MKIINQIKLKIGESEDKLFEKVAKNLRVKESAIDKSKFKILHKSIDARDKNDIRFVYNVAVDYDGSDKIFNPYVSKKEQGSDSNDISKLRPIVVGFGPAGIFASYIFAINGIKPIIIERGKSLDERIKDTDVFFKTMQLNPESNVCFGEGGAGAFSDGKLNTNNKDRTGVYKFILETFVKFGADPKIIYENLPHIGTDKLVGVIKNIRNEILSLGGEIRHNTKFTFSEYKHFANDGHPIILAIGNSSRDTFRDLYNSGFDIKSKTFAIGYRIAHKQALINNAQYGEATIRKLGNNLNNILGPATYKLTYDAGCGRSVYSFCMCPGGYIINSSNSVRELAINGMSYNDRSGLYANSAIVETISPNDLLSRSRVDSCKALAGLPHNELVGVDFQEMIEKKAYAIENGYIPYDILNIDSESEGSDICHDEIFKGQAKKTDKLTSLYDNIGLPFDLNDDIKKALQHFNKIIPGFYNIEANNPTHSTIVLAGVETRTSSPVSLARNEDMMCNVENFYPCGEGLGHGGGIMSCAADGVNVALKILAKKH